jgi:2,3-bisphosphoglycerate-dependent phosphoglycerate mutase
MPTSVFLIRHGAYDSRLSPEGDAASDFGLSDLGRGQALALRDRLARSGEIRPDALFCSTLPRARETAELIAPVTGLTPEAIADLCEWESGNAVLGMDVFMERWRALPVGQRRHHRFHAGCETAAEFTERVQAKLANLVRDYEGRTIALVVHGGVIEAAFAYFLGVGSHPFEGGYPAAAYTSITLWRRFSERDEWVQEFANDTHHLN